MYITGGNRGIGKSIGLKAAEDGANVVIAARTHALDEKGSIFTAAKDIEEVGGKALACIVDVKDESSVKQSMERASQRFGGIDIVVNNAAAYMFTNSLSTSMDNYDLIQTTNTRGTYMVTKCALPYLKKSGNPHVLNISPPMSSNPFWLKCQLPFSISKYGMTLCTLGMAEEFKEFGIGVNSLWPYRLVFATAFEPLAECIDVTKFLRPTAIMGDAAKVIFKKEAKSCTGNCFIDEEVLTSAGETDLNAKYNKHKDAQPLLDFYIDDLEIDLKPRENCKQFANIDEVVNALKSRLSEKLVSGINTVYQFNIEGRKNLLLDLKNGAGAVSFDEPAPVPTEEQPNVVFSLTEEDFLRIFNGRMKTLSAVKCGKAKMEGAAWAVWSPSLLDALIITM